MMIRLYIVSLKIDCFNFYHPSRKCLFTLTFKVTASDSAKPQVQIYSNKHEATKTGGSNGRVSQTLTLWLVDLHSMNKKSNTLQVVFPKVDVNLLFSLLKFESFGYQPSLNCCQGLSGPVILSSALYSSSSGHN